MGSKILIADDEKRICELLCDFFSASGYETICRYNGNDVVTAFRESKDISLVILDIMMPEKDGWQACREIREMSSVPIIMLSARSEDFDMLAGFENGADEYVTKPFSPTVLVKRAEALIKRSKGLKEQGNKSTGLVIDQNAYTAFLDGNPLDLTLKEFEILCYLVNHGGKVLSRDQLLNAVWGYDFLGDTRTVDSHIARLRLKLGEFGSAKLKTVYGVGYKIEV